MIVLSSEQFHALAEALANLKPDFFADKVTADDVKLVLGEAGDIWPASLFDDEAAINPDLCDAA